jgi:hypothetical protein
MLYKEKRISGEGRQKRLGRGDKGKGKSKSVFF